MKVLICTIRRFLPQGPRDPPHHLETAGRQDWARLLSSKHCPREYAACPAPRAQRVALQVVLVEFLNCTYPNALSDRCACCGRPETPGRVNEVADLIGEISAGVSFAGEVSVDPGHGARATRIRATLGAKFPSPHAQPNPGGDWSRLGASSRFGG